MIFNHDNVARLCRVFDVDAIQEISQVLNVDIERSEIEVAEVPLRLSGADQIATRRIAFRSIYPIYAGSPLPCMFHCYGRHP